MDSEVVDEFVGLVRNFAQRDVAPVASRCDRDDVLPAELVEGMRRLGLFGVAVPTRFGGVALDAVTYVRVVEELAAGWMTLAGVLNTHVICCILISRFGTERQKERWLRRLAAGEIRGALSLSEPDAGSDVKTIRCRAQPDGDDYVVDGTKMWVTNGERAGLVALAARTPDGITCFMVEKEPGPSFDGIKVGPPIRKLGYRGVETVEMIYDAHRIPAGNILGEAAGRGQGLAYILTALEWGRLNIAARAVGVARSALDAALKYAGQRRTFGVTIDQHQAIQFKLADMATKIAAARALTIHAARLIGSGMRTDVEAAMAKLFASEVAAEVSLEAMRIHGGYGYTEEFAVERYYRDAPLLLIGEGTNEIQRLVIARGLLKQRDAANPTLLQSS